MIKRKNERMGWMIENIKAFIDDKMDDNVCVSNCLYEKERER